MIDTRLASGIIWTIVGLVVLVILGIIIFVPLRGWHYETGRGEHTGFITATEKHGIIFKTNTVYVKTDTQSSQEDSYCVVDEGVYKQLQKSSIEKTHVNVYFFSWMFAGIKNCGGESDIIYKVEPLK